MICGSLSADFDRNLPDGLIPPDPSDGLGSGFRAPADDLDMIRMVLDSSGWVRSTNSAGGGLRGWHGGPVRWLQDLTHSAGRSDVDNLIHLALTRGRSAGMVQVQGRSAPIRYLQLLVSQLHSPAGAQAQTDPRDLVVEGWDITPLVSQHDDLGMRSLRDSLTGTESRTAFTARLDHDLNRSSIGGHRVALLLASVESCTDRVTGSEEDQGNHVLVTLAARFTTTLRPGDTLGRTAADEFGVICPGIADWPALSAVLDRLRAVAGNPIQFSGKDLQATVSIGAIFADEVGHGGGRASALLAHAGHRMFLDKSSERPAPRPTV